MGAFFDISGIKFNRLTVIGREGRYPCGIITWRCRCDCGGEAVATKQALSSGNTKSCGCLHREVATERQKELAKSAVTHGRSKSAEYRSWRNMMSRCYNPKDKRYSEYAERGIVVCDRWLESFENFFADMGEKPTQKHTLDRIENNGNYEPGNCRWATAIEQNNNKRTTPMVNYLGKIMSFRDAYRASGTTSISIDGAKYRYFKKSMSIYEALR